MRENFMSTEIVLKVCLKGDFFFCIEIGKTYKFSFCIFIYAYKIDSIFIHISLGAFDLKECINKYLKIYLRATNLIKWKLFAYIQIVMIGKEIILVKVYIY